MNARTSMSNNETNAGFSRREIKLIARAGFTATQYETRDGTYRVYLHDNPNNGDVVTSGKGITRLDALRKALAHASELTRCSCGGPCGWRGDCVRCGVVLFEEAR